MLRGSAPTKKRVKCCWTSQQPGGPPKPVAKPIVPSEASISTRKEPRTLMPQLVRDLRYCSHCEAGVEMGESMSLCHDVLDFRSAGCGMWIGSSGARRRGGLPYQ